MPFSSSFDCYHQMVDHGNGDEWRMCLFSNQRKYLCSGEYHFLRTKRKEKKKRKFSTSKPVRSVKCSAFYVSYLLSIRLIDASEHFSTAPNTTHIEHRFAIPPSFLCSDGVANERQANGNTTKCKIKMFSLIQRNKFA